MDLAWWQILIGAVIGLLILTILVVIHELGHAILAVRNGVEVEEFGIGFPPRAKTLGYYKGTRITLNWLPLGGFCKMKGESDDATEPGTYGAASFWAKTKILLAGVTANFVTGVLIFTILAFFGIPKIADNQFAVSMDNHGDKGVVSVYGVVKDSAADKAGLKKGDQIKSIDGHTVDLSAQVPVLTKQYAGQSVDIVVNRDGKDKTITAKIAADDDKGKGRLGIQTEQTKSATIKATWSALIVGIIDTTQFFWMTLAGLGGIIANLFQGLWGLITSAPAASSELAAASDGVSGPIGILGQIFPSAVFGGPLVLLYITGIVAVSLSVMNLLPIPGLDGGRWYLTAWYKLRQKKLTKEKEETIVGWGMMFIFGLIILITIVDILKVF